MKVACFIPIKSNSERVKGKNFRILNGKKLYEYIIQSAITAECFDDVYIDTDSEEIKTYAKELGAKIIDRKKELTSNMANGNDLLVHHFNLYSNYDYYFQLFATAPFLSPKTIKNCVEIISNTSEHDSICTAISRKGFFWFNELPINYRPGVLPRSQDLKPLYEESTGIYGISKEALEKYKCRIGYKPYVYEINQIEAVDINNEEDLLWAEWISANSKNI